MDAASRAERHGASPARTDDSTGEASEGEEDSEGASDGLLLGTSLGELLGRLDGASLGDVLGISEGATLGDLLGISEGATLGT